MKNSLEGIIIKWVSSITDVLREDSNLLFLNNGHPTPSAEIDFWNARLKNLENLYEQLKSDRVRCVAMILEKIDSVYFSSFRTIFKNLITALVIARDITLYINPLSKHITLIQSTDFLDAQPLIKPFLHCVCLVWSRSIYYCTNQQMMKFFRMIANMLILESAKCLDASTIFQGEIDDSLVKIDKIIGTLKFFRAEYSYYRSNLEKFVQPDTNPVFWTFKSFTVFERFDLYVKRLNEIREIFITSIDFIKLEKIEIGGLRGRSISRSMVKIYDDFQKIYSTWIGIQYNPLDPDPSLKEFEQQKMKFEAKCQILERKLGSLFVQSFDECGNLDQINKLIQMAGSLLQRPIILTDVKDKYLLVIEYYQDDLRDVDMIFERALSDYRQYGPTGLPIDIGFPPIAGILMWIHKLRERIASPTTDFRYLEYPYDNDHF